MMKSYDFSFKDDEPKKEMQESIDTSKSIEVFEFSNSVVADYSYQVKFYAINRYYSVDKRNMEKLLNDLGIQTRGSNMYCPFHDDDLTGKASAKYHPDSDMMFCFSESKVYTAFHTLKELYGMDMDKVFRDAWGKLQETDKEEIIRKYGDENNIDKREFINPIWKGLMHVTGQFKFHRVSYKQHKNALFKVMKMISESKHSGIETTVLF